MKKTLGISILVLINVIIFLGYAVTKGWLIAALIVVGGLGLAALVIGAAHLIVDN